MTDNSFPVRRSSFLHRFRRAAVLIFKLRVRILSKTLYNVEMLHP
jgi:hypothetical protein